MFIIIGTIIVFASLLVGYTMHGGKIMALIQINEFIIIGGAAIGSVLIANPLSVVKKIISGFFGSFKGAKVNKQSYLDLMKLLFEIFQLSKKEGIIALEQHVENPEASAIFNKYPSFMKNHHAVAFLCDTLKIVVSGTVQAHDLEELMTLDMETIHHEESIPGSAVGIVGEAFPGLGIVAAVLGIVITMMKIGEGAEAVGESVAAALVGTFFGVLMSYGVIGPIAKLMEYNIEKEGHYLAAIRAALVAFAKGVPPSVAIEYARRSIDPKTVRLQKRQKRQ